MLSTPNDAECRHHFPKVLLTYGTHFIHPPGITESRSFLAGIDLICQVLVGCLNNAHIHFNQTGGSGKSAKARIDQIHAIKN